MTRRPLRTLMSTWHAMLAVQTIGSVDGKHKLPAPKQYVAHTVVWGCLFLAAGMGYGKLAARLSVLVLLTATVIGPFGGRMIDFLGMIADRFATQPPDPGTDPGGGTDPQTNPLLNSTHPA